MRLMTLFAALGMALAAFAATAVHADATVSSASIDGTTATLNFDGADDTETVSVSGGLLVHTAIGGGLNSASDWESAKAGDQTVPADGTFTVVVNGGDGNDSLTVLAKNTEITSATLDGDGGDDVLTGADTSDTLNGGDSNDRLVGANGIDVINGGAGDDTLVWNDGDGSDRMNGDAGNDGVEVNGSPTLGDDFTLDPVPGGVRFQRTNLVPFRLDIGSSETLHANSLGGDDVIAVGDVGSLSVTAAGGSGDDTLTGGGSSETFLGGSGNDTINPGGGKDVVFGDEGDDRVNVRDNTADVAHGGDGNDSVIADPADLDTLDGFEAVDRTPVADTSTRPVKIRGGTVQVAHGKAPIKVSCPAISPANCTGSIALRTAAGVRVAGLKVGLQLGSARFDLAPGASRTLKVKLAKGIGRLADGKGHLKVLAVASTGSAGQIAQSSRRLTLALRTPAKRH
jgi:Ca2+-binding RTX toxin-like protein